METKSLRWFLMSAAIFVMMSSLIRFAILFQDTLASRMMLSASDKLLGFSVHDELWMLAVIELVVSGCLLFMSNTLNRLLLLAWATTNYFVLKFGFVCHDINPSTTAIGSLSDPFHLAHGISAQILNLVPLYLLLGSYVSLGWIWLDYFKKNHPNRVMMQTGRDGFWKMSCPACGGHVKFGLQNEGQKIPCPHCGEMLTLRRNEHLKMSCFFCKKHIEFPAHALGRKIACPHCRKDITLKES
jgi:DNA-directed RNA polymerase subunit RPC12/RpoP